jgi:hypothetical protein
MKENLLSYDAHARRRTGTGSILKELSPFHKKMNDLRGSFRNEFMNRWKQDARKAMEGSASAQDIESGANRRWGHWKRKASNKRKIDDYVDQQMAGVKIDEAGIDVHGIGPEGFGGMSKEQWMLGLHGLRDKISNVDDWAEYKMDQNQSKKHRWMVEKEPNTLWQLALHAFHDGELDEAQLHDTVREIVDEHPGWNHYSLKELNDWKASKGKENRSDEEKFEDFVSRHSSWPLSSHMGHKWEKDEMKAWRELWGDLWPRVQENLKPRKRHEAGSEEEERLYDEEMPFDRKPLPRGPKPERPSIYNFLDYPEYAPWLPPEEEEDEDDPVEKAMVSLRISRFIADTSLGYVGP